MADSNFARLKKDLLFHEKRMQLLLSTRVVDDMLACLAEKTQVRNECAADCQGSLEKFEKGAAEPRLSGRWDELKVASMFQLEVPLRYVVGSNKFEAPEDQDAEVLEDLVRRLQAMSERYPEFDHSDARRNTETLIEFLRTVKFTGRDVSRMREAITAKLEVISELNDLTNVLQDSGFTIAKLQSEIEDLRREEESASAAGEVARAEAAIRRRVEALGKVIDATFFQTHTVESTIESNVSRRRSNVAQFQSAAAMLECIKSEKQELADGCSRDRSKIERGMMFEAGAKDTGRGKVLELQRKSAEKIAALGAKQEKLSARLKALFEEFAEVETALEQVGKERAAAVQEHIELIEGSRHATSDFLELRKYAEQYLGNLDATRTQYDEGLDALHLFEKVLLQEQNFSHYDFNACGNRLNSMRQHVCRDLNAALNEMRSACGELVSRRETQLRTLDECLDVAKCELEIRKEMLDPAAQRFALRVKELNGQREKLLAEIADIRAVVQRNESNCLDLLRKHLPDDEISDVADTLHTRELQSRERVADLRQNILQSREGTTPDSHVAVAKTHLLRAKQTGAPAALPPTLPPSATSESSGALTVAPSSVDKRATPSGMNRSAIAHAMRGRSSRVTAVREEIAKALEGPYASRGTTPGGDRSGRTDAEKSTVVGASETAPESEVAPKRPVRMIGRDVEGPTTVQPARQDSDGDAAET